MADPRPVSAKIAYRLCATVLESAARRLEEKPARTLTRRPEVAATPGPDRRRGREAAAAELRRDAARLHHLAVLPAGAGADAAALGYLLAWLTDAGEMMSELREECAELGIELPAPGDRVGVCRAVIGG